MAAALTVESLSKRFRVQRDRPRTLRESVIRLLTGRLEADRFVWALREVTFTVEQGQALGIIGHNGAGKSTLLRLLCGVGRPTSGRIVPVGPVSGLLELGGGFHLDLTGRDNILTAGLLNGLTEREVRAREAEIIAFAELEEFIDQAMRTYSSGMYLRLAFAVAISFDPATLVVYEVLAVGDARFQSKCFDRIRALRSAGKTLVITSHIPEQIRALCDEVLVLEEGRLVTRAGPVEALACYDELMRERTERRARLVGGSAAPLATGEGARHGTQEATVQAVRLAGGDGAPAETVRAGGDLAIELDYRLARPLPDLALSLGIYSDAHVKCFEVLLYSVSAAFGELAGRGTIRCVVPALPLLPGRYFVNVGLYPPDCDYMYDYHWDMYAFSVVGEPSEQGEVTGVVSLRPEWSVVARS